MKKCILQEHHFDAYVKVKLDNQTQKSVAEENDVSQPTIIHWIKKVESELEKAETFENILDAAGLDINNVAEIINVPVSLIQQHISCEMSLVSERIAELIVHEGVLFEDWYKQTDPEEKAKPAPTPETLPVTESLERSEPDINESQEDTPTEILFESLYDALKVAEDTLRTIQERIITEDDLMAYLKSKKKVNGKT